MSSLMQSLTSSLQGAVSGVTIKSSSLAIVIGTDGHMLTAATMLATSLESAQALEVTKDMSNTDLIKQIKDLLKDAQMVVVAVHADQLDVLKGVKSQLIAVLNTDHIMQANAIEKLLGKRPRYIVLNHDDPNFDQLDQHPPAEQSITFGTHLDADCRLVRAHLSKTGSKLELLVDRHTDLSLNIQVVGKQKVYDALLAVAAAYVLHVPSAEITAALTDFKETIA